MSDDHAAHAIGAYGSAMNDTPHLDRLAREGMLHPGVLHQRDLHTESGGDPHRHLQPHKRCDHPRHADGQHARDVPEDPAAFRISDGGIRKVASRPGPGPRSDRVRRLGGAPRSGRDVTDRVRGNHRGTPRGAGKSAGGGRGRAPSVTRSRLTERSPTGIARSVGPDPPGRQAGGDCWSRGPRSDAAPTGTTDS